MERRTWVLVAAIYVALTGVYAYPLLGAMSTTLPHDVGDPGLNTWILWWNAHAWPLTERWWNAPMFYPATGALALSETFLSISPLTSPLQWFGLTPVVTYNIAFLLSFPLTALAAHALARRLTGRHDAAFIAGLALAFSPWRAAQMPHLQMLIMWWMPLTLFGLHRYLDRRRVLDLVIAGIGWLMNGLTSGYFLVFFAVLVGCWALWFLRTRRDWIVVAATLAISSIPLAPVLMTYQRVQAAYGIARGAEEIDSFGADLTAVWASSPDVKIPATWTIDPRAEGELYPGITILILTALGCVMAWRAHRQGRWHRARKIAVIVGLSFAAFTLISALRGGWQFSIGGMQVSLTRPAKALFAAMLVVVAAVLWDRRLLDAWRRRSVLCFYAVAAATMFLFALGPTGRAWGTAFFYHAPYSWLMALPGGHALRVPARFGILFMLCLGQAAALAFSRMSRQGTAMSMRLAAALACAVFLEGWIPKLPVDPVPPSFDLLQMRPEIPLLELPIASTYTETAAMLRATRHHHVLVNGMSGYSPPHYDPMVLGLLAHDPSVLTALQSFGPLLVWVNHELDGDELVKKMMDQIQTATQVGRSAAGTLYSLPSAAPNPSRSTGPAGGPPLRIQSITASARLEDVGKMIDGDLRSRWETDGHQVQGDQVTINFDRPVAVSRVELDLGEYRNDFPRKLRVEIGTSSGASQTVWEGGTSGLVVLSLMTDRVRLPLVIDLPAGTETSRVTFTVLEGHPEFSWSIAEVRVFGK